MATNTTAMVLAVGLDAIVSEQTATAAAPEKKGTTQGARAITESPHPSPQHRSAAVMAPTTSVTPLNNNRTHNDQKKRKSSIKDFMKVLGTKSRGAARNRNK
jgi:hypothetical protein